MTGMQSSGISAVLQRHLLRNSFPQRFLVLSAALTSQLTHPICTLLPGIRFFCEKIMTAFRKCFIFALKINELKSDSILQHIRFLRLFFHISRIPGTRRPVFYFAKSPAFRLYFRPRVLLYIVFRFTNAAPRLHTTGASAQRKARHHGRGNQRKT